MLSETAKTMFVSTVFSWLIAWATMFGLVVVVRNRALTGSIFSSRFMVILGPTALLYVRATFNAALTWYPVAILACLSAALVSIGLYDVAAICFMSALITQVWRYEFPVVAAVSAVLGWDIDTVMVNRSVVLPATVRLTLCSAFWGTLLSVMVWRSIPTVHTALLLAVSILLGFFSLRTIMNRALQLERCEPMA